MALPWIIDAAGTNWPLMTAECEPTNPVMALENITRPGIDGIEFRELGQRAEPFGVQIRRDFDTVANAETFYLALRASVGRGISFQDVFQRQYTKSSHNLMLVSVGPLMRRAIGAIVGGVVANNGGKVLVTLSLQVVVRKMPTKVPPEDNLV